MQRRLHLAAIVFLGMVAVTSLPGCAENKVKVTGTVTKNGTPMLAKDDTIVTLAFTPENPKSTQTYPAAFKRDSGKYEVELPAGKYRVSYVIVEKDQAPLTSPPEFAQQSHDLTKTQELNLDIK